MDRFMLLTARSETTMIGYYCCTTVESSLARCCARALDDDGAWWCWCSAGVVQHISVGDAVQGIDGGRRCALPAPFLRSRSSRHTSFLVFWTWFVAEELIRQRDRYDVQVQYMPQDLLGFTQHARPRTRRKRRVLVVLTFFCCFSLQP